MGVPTLLLPAGYAHRCAYSFYAFGYGAAMCSIGVAGACQRQVAADTGNCNAYPCIAVQCPHSGRDESGRIREGVAATCHTMNHYDSQ